jgi:hypothetical protein
MIFSSFHPMHNFRMAKEDYLKHKLGLGVGGPKAKEFTVEVLAHVGALVQALDGAAYRAFCETRRSPFGVWLPDDGRQQIHRLDNKSADLSISHFCRLTTLEFVFFRPFARE